jgi:hypothetical protein
MVTTAPVAHLRPKFAQLDFSQVASVLALLVIAHPANKVSIAPIQQQVCNVLQELTAQSNQQIKI